MTSTPDPTVIASELRTAIFRLARRLRSERADAALGDSHFHVLVVLRVEGRQTIGSLADRERVSAPTMSATVKTLEDRGYLVRIPDDEDRRRVYLELTDAGQQLVTDTVHQRDESLAAALTDLEFTAEELDTLARASVLIQRVANR